MKGNTVRMAPRFCTKSSRRGKDTEAEGALEGLRVGFDVSVDNLELDDMRLRHGEKLRELVCLALFGFGFK